MFIVRKRSNNTVIFVSDEDISRDLKPIEIYIDFNIATMEIGWLEGIEIPQHFRIDDMGNVIDLSLVEQVNAGILSLDSDEKIVNNRVVMKSLEEQVEEGLLSMESDEKIVNNRIVMKSLQEQVDEGVMTLESDEKIVNNRIILKSLKEQLAEGLIVLDADQKIVDNLIVEKSIEEQVEEGLLTLESPFEYVSNNEIKKYSVAAVVEKGLLRSKEDCQQALKAIGELVEDKFTDKYSKGYELKLLKDYVYWMKDEKPEADEREEKFNDMATCISDIKSTIKPLKDQVKSLLNSFA